MGSVGDVVTLGNPRGGIDSMPHPLLPMSVHPFVADDPAGLRADKGDESWVTPGMDART